MKKELSNRDKRIVALWKAGNSGSEIAEMIGSTRGAIIGKIFRLRKMGVDVEKPRPPKPQLLSDPETPKAPEKPKKYRTRKIYYPPKKQPNYGDYLTLMQLKMSSCRYIVRICDDGERLYCGQDQVRGPYCNAHAEICYIRPEPERKKKGRVVFMARLKNARDR